MAASPIYPPAGPSPQRCQSSWCRGPSWSQAGKLVSTSGEDSAWRSHLSMSEAEGTRESFLLLLSSSMVPGWLEGALSLLLALGSTGPSHFPGLGQGHNSWLSGHM